MTEFQIDTGRQSRGIHEEYPKAVMAQQEDTVMIQICSLSICSFGFYAAGLVVTIRHLSCHTSSSTSKWSQLWPLDHSLCALSPHRKTLHIHSGHCPSSTDPSFGCCSLNLDLWCSTLWGMQHYLQLWLSRSHIPIGQYLSASRSSKSTTCMFHQPSVSFFTCGECFCSTSYIKVTKGHPVINFEPITSNMASKGKIPSLPCCPATWCKLSTSSKGN